MSPNTDIKFHYHPTHLHINQKFHSGLINVFYGNTSLGHNSRAQQFLVASLATKDTKSSRQGTPEGKDRPCNMAS